jgi:hypothetical protein
VKLFAPGADTTDVRSRRENGFAVEDMDDGRTLVVTAGWSSQAEAALQRPDVDGVWLNYARGYTEPDLSFVGSWPIRRLLVLDRGLNDLSPLANLGATLEDLSLQSAPDAELDLGWFPNLRSLAADWTQVRETLYAPAHLSRLVAFEYTGDDLEPLAVQPSLQAIDLKGAAGLQTLAGVDQLPILTSLKIAAAPRLYDIDQIASTAATLRRLSLEACRRVESLEPVSSLAELPFLGIADCRSISSLQPLARLERLEQFYAWGSTRIEDHDLSPPLQLPRLREIRMAERRGYTPSLAQVKEQLGRT